MLLWRFSDPRDDRYARAGRRGTWTQQAETTCPGCTTSRSVRAQPLIITWEPGSTEIGDFTWPGFDSDVVITESVLDAMRPFAGFEPGPVEFSDDGDIESRGGKRIELPYGGPRLWEVWVTVQAGLNRDRSSVNLEHTCATCGTEQWALYGVERWDSHFDQETKQLVRNKTERLPNAGTFVAESELDGADIFRLREFPTWIFCTDRVRRVTEDKGFSNVSFLEMGETI